MRAAACVARPVRRRGGQRSAGVCLRRRSTRPGCRRLRPPAARMRGCVLCFGMLVPPRRIHVLPDVPQGVPHLHHRHLGLHLSGGRALGLEQQRWVAAAPAGAPYPAGPPANMCPHPSAPIQAIHAAMPASHASSLQPFYHHRHHRRRQLAPAPTRHHCPPARLPPCRLAVCPAPGLRPG